MRITFNGEPRDYDRTVTVADLVAAEAPSPKGIAVAVNAELVPRSVWAATEVADGDRIELLTAAQGG